MRRTSMALPAAAFAAAVAALPARALDADTVGRAPAVNPSFAQPRTMDAEGNPPPVMPGLVQEPTLDVPTGLPPSTEPGARQDPGTGKP